MPVGRLMIGPVRPLPSITVQLRQTRECGRAALLPCSCREPGDFAGMGRNEKGSGGIEVHEPLQPDARQGRVSQRVSRIRSASLRFPPPPLILLNDIG